MLRLDRKTWIRLAVLTVVTILSCGAMAFNFMKLPATIFGIGEYNVTVELPESGGLYQTSVVTYRGYRCGSRRVDRGHRHRGARCARHEVRCQGARRRAGVGAQPLGDRRAIHRADPATREGRRTLPVTTRRRCHSRGSCRCARRYRTLARRDQPCAASDSAGQPAHGYRRVQPCGRWPRARAVSHRRRLDGAGDRGRADR